MPLIGLVRLRWALGGATPPFDPITRPGRLRRDDQSTTGNRVLRSWATMKRHQAGNGLVTWLHVKVGRKSHRRGVSKERNACHAGRLLSVRRRTRVSRRKLAIPAPRETGGQWIAQPCNGTHQGCCVEFRRAIGTEPWFVVDEARDE